MLYSYFLVSINTCFRKGSVVMIRKSRVDDGSNPSRRAFEKRMNARKKLLIERDLQLLDIGENLPGLAGDVDSVLSNALENSLLRENNFPDDLE